MSQDAMLQEDVDDEEQGEVTGSDGVMGCNENSLFG